MSKVYKIITDKILAQLESGTVAWHKPWNCAEGAPANFISKKPYTGINPLLLSSAGYSCPHWVTYKQAKQLGGNVKKGEHGEMIIFFAVKEKTTRDHATGDTEKHNFAMLRYYTVFNLEQCEGIDYTAPTTETYEHTPLESAELIAEGYKGKPRVEHGGARACYSPQLDYIQMPEKKVFPKLEEYYSTLFHEMTHSTGNTKRLNRDTLNSAAYFGSHEYSKEELVAEFGACFLCGQAGIETKTIDNSAAYIAGWKKALRNDEKLVIQAAGKAQKAADYILGK